MDAIEEFLTYNNILTVGKSLVFIATVTGMTILLYFFVNDSVITPRAVRLITDNFWFFTRRSMPYIISFILCQYLSIEFEIFASSNRPIADITSKYYLKSKIILNGTAILSKHYLFCTRTNISRAFFFVSYLILTAISESMCDEKYVQKTTNISTVLLLLLTLLIMIAPDNAYKHLKINETITWKRCSLVYSFVTSVCNNWLKSANQNSPFDALLLVLVVHIQLIFLSITYFSDGQQLLNNVAGRGSYNPMADSLDIYFTADSIMSKTRAYINN